TMGAILSALMVGYALALMALPSRLRPSQVARDRLLLSYSLLILFLPLRLVSTWYENHIFTADWLPDRTIFILGGLMAAISILLVLITTSDKRTSAVFSSIGLVVTAIISGLARFKEGLFIAGANTITSLSPAFKFYFLVLVLAITLVFIIIRVFGFNDITMPQ